MTAPAAAPSGSCDRRSLLGGVHATRVVHSPQLVGVGGAALCTATSACLLPLPVPSMAGPEAHLCRQHGRLGMCASCPAGMAVTPAGKPASLPTKNGTHLSAMPVALPPPPASFHAAGWRRCSWATRAAGGAGRTRHAPLGRRPAAPPPCWGQQRHAGRAAGREARQGAGMQGQWHDATSAGAAEKTANCARLPAL